MCFIDGGMLLGCRGMATFEEGIPEFSQEFRIIQGGTEGTIVGLYPLDSRRCYFFHGFSVSQARGTAPLFLQKIAYIYLCL